MTKGAVDFFSRNQKNYRKVFHISICYHQFCVILLFLCTGFKDFKHYYLVLTSNKNCCYNSLASFTYTELILLRVSI